VTAALAAVAASSLGWAVFDVLRKRLAAAVAPVPLAALLALGQLPLFLAGVWLEGRPTLARGYLAPGLVALVLNTAASVLFLRAVQLSPLSLTIPLLSLTPVFTALCAAALLGEVPRPQQWAGIVLVVAGALALNVRAFRPGALGGAWTSLWREPGSPPMMGVALLWSLGGPVDKQALAFAPVSVHGAIQCGGIALALIVALAASGRLRELARIGGNRGSYAAALVAATAALALQFVAIQLVFVSVVEAVKRAIGMTSAVVIGRALFAEPLTAGKLSGIVLMSAGVALILA
jgi:drug/metabolite transporter (DMT)-like permease